MTIFFITDLPEMSKSEIPPFEFSPIPGDCGELAIQYLARMSSMKMLLNAAKSQWLQLFLFLGF